MKELDVEISQLLPIEPYLKWGKIEEFVLTEHEEDIAPITIIRYGEDFLTCDGHNRTIARLLKGKSTVPAKLIENKWDEIKERIIRPNEEGLFGNGYSIRKAKRGYEKYWKPGLMEIGLERFQDYFKVYPKYFEELNMKLREKQK